MSEELIRWTMTAATRSTILAALSEAADAKRDKIEVCPEDHSDGCGTCMFREDAAGEYDRVAGIIGETYDAEPEDSSEWRDGYEAGARDELASCAPARPGAASMLLEFHAKYAPVAEPPFGGTASTRRTLLAEECQEYQDAEDAGDLTGVAKELADIVYVAYGSALCYGIDLDAAVAAVHASNMTKDMPLTPGGKAVKGQRYREADVSHVLRDQHEHEEEPEHAESRYCQATDGETRCTLVNGHDKGDMATMHEEHGRPWDLPAQMSGEDARKQAAEDRLAGPYPDREYGE